MVHNAKTETIRAHYSVQCRPEVVVHLSKALLYGFVHRSRRKLGLDVNPKKMLFYQFFNEDK